MKAYLPSVFTALSLVSLVGIGCSKNKEASATDSVSAGESTNGIANPAEAVVVAQDLAQAVPLSGAASAVATGNYDAAAAAVVRAQYGGTLTDEQRQQIQQVQQQMLNAAQKNAEAMQAYQSMTRALNGR